jgi:outer membrane protein assembly factor BamB
MKKFSWLLFVPLALLGGCSVFETDNSEPPAELVEYEKKIAVAEQWHTDSGTGTGEFYLKLEPFVDEQTIYTVDVNGRLTAYSIDRGKELWSKRFKGVSVTGGVNGGEGFIVFGTADGEVIAVSAEDGQERWRAQVSSEVMAVSRIDFGIVVVRTNDGKVFAINVDSGAQRWQAGRKTPALSLRGVSEPLSRYGLVLSGFDNGKLAALSLLKGQVAWETAIATPRGRSELERMVDIDATFVERDGIVYVATYQGKLAAVDLKTGQLIWSRKMSSFMGLTVDRTALYLTDDVSAIWAIDRRTGATLWKQTDLRLRTATTPAVIDNYVVVADYQGYLHWIDKYEGFFVNRVRSDSDGVTADPQVIGTDTLLILGRSGELTTWKIDSK